MYVNTTAIKFYGQSVSQYGNDAIDFCSTLLLFAGNGIPFSSFVPFNYSTVETRFFLMRLEIFNNAPMRFVPLTSSLNTTKYGKAESFVWTSSFGTGLRQMHCCLTLTTTLSCMTSRQLANTFKYQL